MRKTKYFFIMVIGFSLLFFACDGSLVESDNSVFTSWPESSPEDQGLSGHVIQVAFVQANQLPFLNGIVIVRNGYLVAESYYNNYHKNSAHNIRSVSKSFLSSLYGIALNKNYIPSIQGHITDYFPDYEQDMGDIRFGQVTIENMLTMHGGIDTDHNNYGQIFSTNDWIKATFQRPLIANPGEEFHYTTAGTHILSALLTRATGMSTYDFAQKYLLKASGIQLADWEKGPQGYYFGGNSMHTSPQNMAKFGLIYLNAGRLNNIQIVPESWVAASIADNWNADNISWGPLSHMGYGYLWWLGTLADHDAFIAIGHGGQFILVFSDLQLIITTVSQSYDLTWDEADIQERAVLHFINDYIMPAIID
jgi:CubicO group peptidase (beta-lactamase class C family)